jgi:hypothetical protein
VPKGHRRSVKACKDLKQIAKIFTDAQKYFEGVQWSVMTIDDVCGSLGKVLLLGNMYSYLL